jgi:nicotinamide-nucleotide amidase
MEAHVADLPPAVIVTVGDELLGGDRTDTNARWLAEALTSASFRVREILSVGDAEEEIRDALARAEARGSGGVVIVTGGLGPTLDDRTREGAALHLGVPIDEDGTVLEALEARYRDRGYPELPRLNRRLARVPRGARVLPNPVGSAPGLELPGRDGGAVVFLLPGVPAEMRALVRDAVLPRLDELLPMRPPPPAAEVVRTAGIPESELARQVEEALPGSLAVNVQYRPSVGGVELRVSARGPAAPDRLREALAVLDPLLAPWRYGGRNATLEGSVLEAYRDRGWSLGAAESCTGGMLGSRLTSVAGSSAVFRGGVVAYDNRVKTGLLGVPASVLAEHGAVSGPAAAAMAEGARAALGADVGVSITGVAGPGGGSEARPVGTVWFGISGPGSPPPRTEVRRFPGDREEVRRRATDHALRLLLERTRESGPQAMGSRKSGEDA